MKNPHLKAHTPDWEARKVTIELLPFVILGFLGIISFIGWLVLLVVVATGGLN